MTDRVKVWKYIYDITIETNNFAFEVNVILGLKSSCSDYYWAKVGLDGPEEN